MKKLLIFLAFFTLNADELCKELYSKYLSEYEFLANYKDFCAGINEIYLSLSNDEKTKLNNLYFNGCKNKKHQYCKYIKTLYENSQLTDKSLYYKALELDCLDIYGCFDILNAMKNEATKDKEYFYKFLEQKCKNNNDLGNKKYDFCYVFVQYKYRLNDDLMCEKNPSVCVELAEKSQNEAKKYEYLDHACMNKINVACKILMQNYKDKKDYKAMKKYEEIVQNNDNLYLKNDEITCSLNNLKACKDYIINNDISKEFYLKYSLVYEDLCLKDNINFCKDACMLEYKTKNYEKLKKLIDFTCKHDEKLCKELSKTYLMPIYEKELL